MKTVSVVITQGYKIWHIGGKVTIAKNVSNGRFVKNSYAQSALDFRAFMLNNNRAEAINMAALPIAVCLMAIFTGILTATLIPEGYLHLIVAGIMSLFFVSGLSGIIDAVKFDMDKGAI